MSFSCKKNRKINLILLLFFIGFNSFSQDTTSKIYILPGATYLSNFGNEIDNIKIAGNARFMHDSVIMSCDTAYIYNKTQSVDAIGKVKINQGDSIFLYGDTLKYFGNTKMAYVTGNVKLIENDLTLTCDSIVYDLNTNIARYTTRGKVISKKNSNTLTSIKGFYLSSQKKLSFKDSVILKNKDYTMKSDTLDYFEETEIAYFFGNTTIKGDDNFIFCKNGWYDTRNDIAQFSKDAYLISDGHTLSGDSLYYNGNTKYGKAINNVTIADTANEIIVTGQFAEHYETKNTSVVTGIPIVHKWFDTDTLFLTADTIKIYSDTTNNKNKVYAHFNVRFLKSDIQGVCDSMMYLQADSTLKMFTNPIIWTKNSQLNGDTIHILLNKKSIKEINLLNNSFIIEQIERINNYEDTSLFFDSTTNKTDTVFTSEFDTVPTDMFNQIKGKTIKGIFLNDTIRKVYINGNGQSIYYTGDEGKPKQALNKIICSNIIMTFTNNKVSDILFLKQPEGNLYPLNKLSQKDKQLEGFTWEETRRPTQKSDLIKAQVIPKTTKNRED